MATTERSNYGVVRTDKECEIGPQNYKSRIGRSQFTSHPTFVDNVPLQTSLEAFDNDSFIGMGYGTWAG